MAYTPPNNQIIVMTNAQLWELIAGMIIDNNNNQITPYKLRAVLNVMVSSLSRVAGYSPVAPIRINPDTGAITVDQVSIEQAGVLSPAQYISLLAGTSPTPQVYGEIRIKIKAEGNAAAEIEEGDIVTGWIAATTIWDSAIFLGGDTEDLNNYKPIAVIEWE